MQSHRNAESRIESNQIAKERKKNNAWKVFRLTYQNNNLQGCTFLVRLFFFRHLLLLRRRACASSIKLAG
jgi:hypothetical protein